MLSIPRVLLVAVVALSLACPQRAEPPEGLSPEERLNALESAGAVLISAGDLDGDGSDEIVLTASMANAPSAGVAGTLHKNSVAALESFPGDPSADDVVLTRNTAGDFVVAPSNAGYDFARAQRVGAFIPNLLEGIADTFWGVLRDPDGPVCGAISGLVDAVAGGVAYGSIGLGEAVQFIKGTIFQQDTSNLDAAIERYQKCLDSSQTFSGCVQGDLAEIFGRRDHCYQVSDTGSGACNGAGVGSRLCSHEDSSCCNYDFIFGKVFRADLRNQAPLLLEPANGPMPDASQTVILGSPIQIGDLSDIERGMPGVDAIRCLFNSTLEQRNPVTLSVDADAGCATNATQDGHVLEGRVVQCIHEDEAGVYTTIEGTGEDTRLSWVNEFEGTRLFEGVRDHFRDNVRRTLAEMNQLGLSCDGANVDGGTVTTDPDGGVVITPNDLSLGGVAWGDPHLRTQDGTAYDFQRVGEFLLIDGDDSARVEVRLAPYGSSRYVSVITALAADVGGAHVQIDARPGTPRLRLDGADTGPVDLPGGGRLALDSITWPDGSRLAVRNDGSYLSVYLYLPETRAFRGLLGDRDGDPANDFRLRNGTVLPKPLDAAGWASFTQAWRISQAESLFTYAEGESTDTFTDLSFPGRNVSTRDLSAEAYATARAICVAAGITDPVLLDACILDVGFTGESSFAGAVGATPAPRAVSGNIPSQPGLVGQYFSDLAFQNLVLERVDATLDFNWGFDRPAPEVPFEFSARWTGLLIPPTTGTYHLYTRSDDTIRVWANGERIINNWVDHAETEDVATIALTGGVPVDLRVEFYDSRQHAVARLLWDGPGITKAPVPTTALRTGR